MERKGCKSCICLLLAGVTVAFVLCYMNNKKETKPMNGTLVKDWKNIKKDGKKLAKDFYKEAKNTGEDILENTIEKGTEMLDDAKEVVKVGAEKVKQMTKNTVEVIENMAGECPDVCDCFLEKGKETKEV